MLKAKFKEFKENGKNLSGDKEQVGNYKIVALYKGQFKTPITVTCWMGRSSQASVVYASIWVQTSKGAWCAGHGSAGGYGYHKESAAIQDAIDSAGIELFGDVYGGDNKERAKKQAYIGGVGDTAIKYALEAIARAAGYRKFTVV